MDGKNLPPDPDQPSAAAGTRKRCWGMFTRRERWGLSLRGWLTGIGLCCFAMVLWVLNVQPFLAQTHRVETKTLVVEGWVRSFTIRGAVAEFRNGQYDKIYTTGGPEPGTAGFVSDYQTSASVGADLLVDAGLPTNVVQMVPSRVWSRDRTYSSAVALREYFRTNAIAVKRFNILTEDIHGRRTRMLFQEAFGPDVEVGIISIPDPDYDPARWWRYSEGVREVLGESIAWCYATLLFHPPKQAAASPP